MKTKNLETISKLIVEFENIEKEISEIQSLAKQIVVDKTESTFSLKVRNITKEEETKNKISFDEDGSLVHRANIPNYPSYFGFIMGDYTKKEDEKGIVKFKPKLSEKCVLLLLNIIIGEKNIEKQEIVKKLKELGVQ